MPKASRQQVGIWLLAIALIILAMVTIGGLTRLTGSGLSITEWDPIMGAFPPLSHAQWADAFAKYQKIPQYLPGRLQGHLLVGMVPSPAGPASGRGVHRPLPLVRLERRDPQKRLAAHAGAVPVGRAPRLHRLVDGGVGA
jgi:hypothetical protein